jgi:hypothetical protein
MDRKLAAPALAALVLAAGAFGVHLGQSAIDRINPLYFQGAAVHPRDRGAAVDPASLAAQGPRFADLYGWEEGAAARAADCAGCEAPGTRDSGGAIRFAAVETGWKAERAPDSAELLPEELPPGAEEQTDFEAQRAEVGRYASYAIEAAPDPAQPPIAVASAEQ